MGYQVAVLDWQWQSRWLIAPSFIRDEVAPGHGHNSWWIPTQSENSHGWYPPGRPRKYSPFGSEGELSIRSHAENAVRLPRSRERGRFEVPNCSAYGKHMSDHFLIRKQDTE